MTINSLTQNLPPKQIEFAIDWELASLKEILDDLEINGYNLASLTELEVLKYSDDYRQPHWLVREIRKLAANIISNLENPKPKRKSSRLHNTMPRKNVNYAEMVVRRESILINRPDGVDVVS